MISTQKKGNGGVLVFLIGGLLFMLVTVSSCYNNKAEILYPPTSCDTANVRFSTHIVPLLNTNCNGCHSGSTPAYGIDLTNYTDVKAEVNNGRLWGAVSHSLGFSPMPKNSNKLSDCNINKIKLWILAGAPNN